MMKKYCDSCGILVTEEGKVRRRTEDGSILCFSCCDEYIYNNRQYDTHVVPDYRNRSARIYVNKSNFNPDRQLPGGNIRDSCAIAFDYGLTNISIEYQEGIDDDKINGIDNLISNIRNTDKRLVQDDVSRLCKEYNIDESSVLKMLEQLVPRTDAQYNYQPISKTDSQKTTTLQISRSRNRRYHFL
jgi:hypothetical protein